jgi:hypothetical protein
MHQKLHHDLIVVVHCRRVCKSPNILRGRKEKCGCGGEPRRGGDDLPMVRADVVGWVGDE